MSHRLGGLLNIRSVLKPALLRTAQPLLRTSRPRRIMAGPGDELLKSQALLQTRALSQTLRHERQAHEEIEMVAKMLADDAEEDLAMLQVIKEQLAAEEAGEEAQTQQVPATTEQGEASGSGKGASASTEQGAQPALPLAAATSAPADYAGPYSTLSDPLPLPSYTFDATLSEDENFLTWASILARHSTSRKGNMGTIFIRPPTSGDPRQPGLCTPPAAERVIMHANNVPILYASAQKAVPEVHAEALAISRAARRGVALEGCTVYVTFPPCVECAKLLVAVGVKRCIYKRSLLPTYAESFLSAARVAGIEVCGTSDAAFRKAAPGQEEEAYLESILDAREADRSNEAARDARVRQYWAAQNETGEMTKKRVDAWWTRWMDEHRAAAQAVAMLWGGGGEAAGKKGKQLLKARKREAEKAGASTSTSVPAKRAAEEEGQESSSKAQRTEDEP